MHLRRLAMVVSFREVMTAGYRFIEKLVLHQINRFSLLMLLLIQITAMSIVCVGIHRMDLFFVRSVMTAGYRFIE